MKWKWEELLHYFFLESNWSLTQLETCLRAILPINIPQSNFSNINYYKFFKKILSYVEFNPTRPLTGKLKYMMTEKHLNIFAGHSLNYILVI